MKYSQIMLFFVFALVFASCGENWIYDKKMSISNARWTYQDSLNFDFEIADTFKIYNLYVEVEHDETYPFQNIYLMTHTKFPSGERPAQRINVDLANSAGSWLGKKSGKNFTHRIDLQENAYFNKMGKYTLTLAQFMRQDSLPISSIRFGVEDTKQTRDKVSVKQGERPKVKPQSKYLVQ
jgi:gliding motility-associated lipoprotein GldH